MVTWQLTIDANDPERLVEFWGPALGYVKAPPPEGFATWNEWYASLGVPDVDLTTDECDRLVDPEGHGPRIWFQFVPEEKAGKNRLHLDLKISGGRATPLEERITIIEDEVAELVAAGGSVQRRYPADWAEPEDPNHYFVVMGDPEGNEFCVA